MKQIFILILIFILIIITVYFFIEFFQAGQTVKGIKKDHTPPPERTESTGVYTGAIRKAKMVKGKVETKQREMLGEYRKTTNTSNIKKSRRQAQREKEREQWYQETLKKQQQSNQ